MQNAARQRTPQEILGQALERKKSRQRGYSLRALSRDIGKSPGFVSQVVSGKRRLTPELFTLLADALEVDEMARMQLSLSLVRDSNLPDEVKSNIDQATSSPAQTEYSRYQESSLPDFDLLRVWYSVAILDLTSLKSFRPDLGWISRKLGLSHYQVELAVRDLFQGGLLIEENGTWKKSKHKLRFSTVASKSTMRNYHKQMIEKAKDELLTKTDQASFERRLITCITVGANSANIERAKRRINEMTFEISEILSEGECDEVFQFNAQMFALTNPDDGSNESGT